MHITIIRRNVEIAGNSQMRVRNDFFTQPAGERRQPGKFVGIFFAADFLTVGHVGADDADAAGRCRDQALLRVGKIRVADGDVDERLPCEQRDAVIGLLSSKGDAIARSLNFEARKFGVLQLGFLQADNIRLTYYQPFQQLRQTNLQ